MSGKNCTDAALCVAQGRSDLAPSVTVIIPTFNEEVHIERCIARIAPIAARIIVLDSFSDDKTAELALRAGAELYRRKFKHQADQLQWAQENCDIRTKWILRLDADEYLEKELIEEVLHELKEVPQDVTGIEFKLKVIFRGKWIRYGGYYSTILTRMWRTGFGYYEQRWMDEKLILKSGSAKLLLSGNLVDENLKSISWWTDKHNRYATRHMVEFINKEYKLFDAMPTNERALNPQNRYKRFLREAVFGPAPLYLRSVMHYFYTYIIRLGFLDGREGFVWHTLHGLWYFLLIDAKIDEARRFIERNGVEAFRNHLRDVHGIVL